MPQATGPPAGAAGAGAATSPGLPPAYRRMPLRIACVQFDTQLGKVAENAATVRRMTAGLRQDQVDLLVLPEMALSGYMFKSGEEIRPLLEKRGDGPTSALARELASRLQCHVVAGYPEALAEDDDAAAATAPQSANTPASSGVSNGALDAAANGTLAHLPADGTAAAAVAEPQSLSLVGYNSAVLASPAGEVIGNYRKTFLYETDKVWSREGDGFSYFDLPEPLGRVAIGICMDLNPKEFLAPWNAFELATYCVTNEVDVLVCPVNWLDQAELDGNDSDTDSGHTPPPPPDPLAPSESNLNYWAARLAPLHDPPPRYDPQTGLVHVGPAPQQKDLVFVVANRVGTERGTKFVGTSCVMTLSANPSAIELVECCNRSEERVMVCEVT